MPLCAPCYPKGPYRFVNREYLIITYKTDLKKLQAVVPEPLEVTEPLVKYEFIRMPDSSGFGDYTESGQVIPVNYKGQKGLYVHSMYLDLQAPIAAGREIWGFPKTFAQPKLFVDRDALVGSLDYYSTPLARASMNYKYESMNKDLLKKDLEETPNFLIKLIPDVDGEPKILQLVSYNLKEVHVKEAYRGKATLELFSHVMAPLNDLPILEIVEATHFIADLTLPYGKVVHDYLK